VLSRLVITELPLIGLKRITRQPLGDHRGFLVRLFCAQELAAAGWVKPVSQINHTHTAKRGTVRGVHYQTPPHAEQKLVSCIRGEVWDVAVDLRPDSTTFLQWHAEKLTAENGQSLLIPEGFAHGFQALTDHAELIYCHSTAYSAECEAGIRPTDPMLLIDWPLPIQDLSSRDSRHPLLNDRFPGVAP